ncbi:MAG: LysM peptidoglycan-binding domain-containing protein [Firmicutes bacterium]|nr:LysM peptidoglycan-binding domain-containing protein [Bacillota bacterium]
MYGVSVDGIAAHNRLTSLRVYPGQMLLIPIGLR